MLKTYGHFHQSKQNVNGQKTQSIEGKIPTFLAFSHPDWFLPYAVMKNKKCTEFALNLHIYIDIFVCFHLPRKTGKQREI